jgi:ATP adenylyltransferase
MEYVGSDKSGRCIFCEPSEPTSDRSRLILHRGERVFVLMNRFPYSTAHLMVAPYAHQGRLHHFDAATRAELIERAADCERILEEACSCEGLNVGFNAGAAAGAGFTDHLHLHIVPRWQGDTNFMTVVGELRVIPEHLERTWDELAPRFAELTRR